MTKRSKRSTKRPTKKSTKKATKKSAKRRRTAKRAVNRTTARTARTKKNGQAQPKRLSALDAAAQVLKKAGKPMRSQELIAAMATQGLWKSPAGKTPSATLYAGMLKEIVAKGSEARFRKVDRGQFVSNG